MSRFFKSVAGLFVVVVIGFPFYRAHAEHTQSITTENVHLAPILLPGVQEGNVIPVTVAKWSVLEIPLTAKGSYKNPYTEVTVTATFRGPSDSGIIKNIQGFWDGGSTFRVRFTPTVTGAWTYSITSSPSDAGITRSGTIRVVQPDSAEHGFLRRDPSSPYNFIFDDGTHYFMMGQTYYNIIENVAGNGSWQTAIQNSKAYGFNKIRILLYSWGPVPSLSGALFEDIIPYGDGILSTKQNKYSTGNHDVINVAFWQNLDRLISHLKSQGMIADIILFSDGDYTYGTNSQNQRYIKYALARLSGQTNVIWCVANEYDYVSPWATTTETAAQANGFEDGPGYTAADAQMNFLGNTLHDDDPYMVSDSLSSAPRPLSSHQHSRSVFLWFNLANTILASNWFTSAIIQYHTFYPSNPAASIYGDVNGNKGSLTNRTHNMPVVNDEYSYVGSNDTRTIARNAIWGIVMGGAFGTLGGDNTAPSSPIFSGEWVDQPLMYGDIKVMMNLMTGLSYWKMTPMNSKVSGLPGSTTRVYASGMAANYVVYVANGGAFTFNASSSSSCLVTRLDPRLGIITSLGLKSGAFSLTAPAGNADYVYHIYGGSCQ